MEADDLLCSRNARPQKALVGRAQWKINQPPSLKRYRASLEGSIYKMDDGRSDARSEEQRGAPFLGRVREKEDAMSPRLCSGNAQPQKDGGR